MSSDSAEAMPAVEDPYILYDKNAPKTSEADEPNANKLFSDITKLQKRAGDMFLFGKITKPVLDIIVRIYHENIARFFSEGGAAKPSFMLGILQLDTGEIYMTISEDPFEDGNFQSKIQSLRHLLGNANIIADVPEEPLNKLLLNSQNYRNPNTYTYNANKLGLVLPNHMMIIEGKDGYERSSPIQATLINSEAYLENRRSTGRAFLPFKKYSDNVRKRYAEQSKPLHYECNNGSTCVESKLFSYIYSQGKSFENVAGFAAYWVSNKLPPTHYLAKYSYCRSDENANGCEQLDDEKLDRMTRQILADTGVSEEDLEKYKTILQPLALSCPGCLMNWNDYITKGIRGFNYQDCQTTAPGKQEGLRAPEKAGGFKAKQTKAKQTKARQTKTKRRKISRNTRSAKKKKTNKKAITMRIRSRINSRYAFRTAARMRSRD